MRIGSMVASKRWDFRILSPLPTDQYAKQRPTACALRGRENSMENSMESTRSTPNSILEEGETLHRDALKAYAYSFRALQNIENTSANSNDVERNSDKKSFKGSHILNRPTKMIKDASAVIATSTANNSLQFSLLMENLDKIEDIFAGADLVRLEREILVHIEKLGALRLFRVCLSGALMEPTVLNRNSLHSEYSRDRPIYYPVGEQKGEVIVRTGKKERRKIRTRTSVKAAEISTLSTTSKQNPKFEEPMVYSKSKKLVIARNESEMSRGVKEVAELERIRTELEQQIGQAANFARWAEAAGVDQKTLQQRLQFGWHCRDKLIKSTHSLVVYLARNYKGTGISFDDLLQAGTMGVLKGAERFDITRGYRFSTYVQYWIRKSLLTLVARYSKGIKIPVTIGKVMKRIQKTRRAFFNREGRYPQDEEMADITGLSLVKVRLASKCSRVLGSLDQEMGHGWCTKFMEVTSDMSVEPPEDIIMRIHMKSDISKFLEGLDPRELYVLVLRYGLEDGRRKSLEEIAGLFGVSKEWIRQVEKAALTKIRREDIQRELKYYLH